MKKPVIALQRHSGEISVDGYKTRINLPKGCTGLLFIFESKVSAYRYWGKNTELQEIELEDSDG